MLSSRFRLRFCLCNHKYESAVRHVRAAAGGLLHLDGDVADVEIVRQHFGGGLDHFVVVAGFRFDQVHGEGVFRGAQALDMEMVHGGDAR